MGTEQGVHVIATQHLDVAWLWARAPYGEEVMRLCFERAIEMAEADPSFVFSRSTVWSFWVMEQKYPELFEKIKECVANGQIELCGGEWVEPDHLIPGGESLVRQSALGQWYYLETFGKCATVCWDPDIFGHPHSLPQIIKKCGMDGFYSHRCRPQDDDGKPLHQFIWEGPDGSQVMYLAGTWVRAPEAEAIGNALEHQRNQELPAAHVVTGLASDRRITMQVDWVPLPKQTGEELELAFCKWSAADDVLADMQAYADKLPVVKGELGFQFTGTYTSNIFNKKTNRAVEALLVDAEKAAAWASCFDFRYPAEQLRQAWRDHCVNQFHDIICGCSVADVHREDRELWADVIRRAEYARDEALAYLCDRIHAAMPEQDDDGDVMAVFNLLSWSRQSVVEVELAAGETLIAATHFGDPLPVQITGGDGRRTALVQPPEVAGVGYELVEFHRRPAREESMPVGAELVMENAAVRVEFDETTGEIISLVNKATGDEEIRDGGRGNKLLFLEDNEQRMPAWNIAYSGKTFDVDTVSVELTEAGPIRQTVRVVRQVQLLDAGPPTTITQDIRLYADSSVIRFDTHGDWRAAEVMVKAVFDLAFESETSVSEAPYAAIERDLTERVVGRAGDADTAAEDAGNPDKSFEEQPDSYMQRWLDLSDGHRGMLFVSDALYGYDAKTDQVRLSLMRAPLDPSDMLNDAARPMARAHTGLGPFSFSYGIVAHEGNWQDVDAPRLGCEFNHDLLVRPVRDGYEESGVWRDWWDTKHAAPDEIPLYFIETVQSKGSLVTVVKRAEDGNGLILRIVETRGVGDVVRIRCHERLQAADATDLLERNRPGEQVHLDGADIEVTMTPWEIKTVRIRL